MGLVLGRMVASPKAQVLRGKIGVNNFVRVHLSVGIPQTLKLPKGIHQLGTEHLGQQSTSRLAVSMFPGKRAAVAQHEVGGTVDKFSVLLNSRAALKIKAYAHVNATIT